MNAAVIVAHLSQRLGRDFEIAGTYSGGESGGATKVVDEHANRYVLKYGSGGEFRAANAALTTAKLRGLGYPAPEYVAVGKMEDTSYALLRAMPGEPLAHRVFPALLPQLLHLNDLQRGQGDSENDEPDRIIRGVTEGYQDFCVIETLRSYSARKRKDSRCVATHCHQECRPMSQAQRRRAFRFSHHQHP